LTHAPAFLGRPAIPDFSFWTLRARRGRAGAAQVDPQKRREALQTIGEIINSDGFRTEDRAQLRKDLQDMRNVRGGQQKRG
jgi:hypothetical protein